MKYAFLFLVIFTYSNCIGQSGGKNIAHVPSYSNGLISSDDRYGSTFKKGYISYDEVLEEYQNIEGSPYLYNKEIIVDLILFSDSIIKNVPIKYDLYGDEIIAKKRDGSTIILDQKFYKGFVYTNGDQKETYLRLHPDDLTFYRVFFQTKEFVFYKTTKTRLDKIERNAFALDTKSQKFVQRPSYYVMQNNTVLPVVLRYGEALKYFPREYESQVNALKKKLKIKKIRKEKHYVRIIDAFEFPDKK